MSPLCTENRDDTTTNNIPHYMELTDLFRMFGNKRKPYSFITDYKTKKWLAEKL